VAHLSNLVVSSATVTWVAVRCCAMRFQSFPKYNSCHTRIQLSHKFVNFDAKMLVFLQYVLLEKDTSSTQNNNFVHRQIFRSIIEFRKCHVQIFKKVLSFPVCQNFRPSCQVHSRCLWSLRGEGCGDICLVSSNCYTKVCLAGCPSSLSVCPANNVLSMCYHRKQTFQPQQRQVQAKVLCRLSTWTW
jgi:hypothetical protein